MKITYPLLIFLIISFSGQSLCAQKIFREGYIVKKTGESFTGLVEYSAKQKIPSECIFKRFDIARPVAYFPGEILAFGYRNGNRYESKEVDNKVSFFEVLVAGKIVLYQKGSDYYLDKDHLGLVRLVNGPVTYNSDGGKEEFKSLADFLSFITEGKAGTISQKFNIRNEIVQLITSYNMESGMAFSVYNRSIAEKQLTQDAWKSGAARNRFGVLSGINLYTLNMKFNPNISGFLSDHFIPDPVRETGMVAGFSYERLLLRRTDRIAVRINVFYNSKSFYSYSERPGGGGGTIRDDAYFSFTGIKVPVLFQYSLTGGRIVPCINAGVACQYFLKTDYMHVAEAENILHEITTYVDHDMVFNKGELTGVCGLGVRTRILTKLNLHLTFMLETGKGLFLNELQGDTNSMKLKPYNQRSFQSTLLIGITF